jgi:glycosyltransferase involved in cell wall biosynthesis
MRNSPARWWLRRAALRMLTVPSTPVPLRRRRSRPARRVRLLALVSVRNEADRLPSFLADLARHVDGIVALDDGSTDGSDAILAAHASVVELVRVPADRPAWDDLGNHRRLVGAAVAHGAEWIVSIDADERLERGFRSRAERVIARGARLGYTAYAVRFRELWDDAAHVRVDGVWGAKAQPRLFRARADHAFSQRPVHGAKAPLQSMWRGGRLPVADLFIYHLGMIDPADRIARRARYEALDPTGVWQPGLGYAYLTDERGLRRRRVPRRRGFVAPVASTDGGRRVTSP